MKDSVLTNTNLLKYWELLRGEVKTRLTITEVMSLGIHVTCFDVLTKSMGALYWTDGFADIEVNGNRYTSFPDVIADTIPAINEEKGINNNAVTFKVSNVNPSIRNLALAGSLKDSKINIRLAILNPLDGSVLDSMLMFSGFFDYCKAETSPNDEVNEITVNVNSVYKKIDLQPRTIAANSVYQSYWPGDAYFSLLGQVNQNQTWTYNNNSAWDYLKMTRR
ncbi:DUF2163 domain-containing protein [Cedecea lapagei]|uniref:DUF2163 domain-containing protein n=1 Tax=Cedecea lapagei TaxID=158823 RepID=UPI001BD05A50|nr:DUF2163 domain-containing protein [Cedecea lapagei]